MLFPAFHTSKPVLFLHEVLIEHRDVNFFKGMVIDTSAISMDIDQFAIYAITDIAIIAIFRTLFILFAESAL